MMAEYWTDGDGVKHYYRKFGLPEGVEVHDLPDKATDSSEGWWDIVELMRAAHQWGWNEAWGKQADMLRYMARAGELAEKLTRKLVALEALRNKETKA